MAVTAKRPNAESCVTPLRSSRRGTPARLADPSPRGPQVRRRFDRELKAEELTALPLGVDHPNDRRKNFAVRVKLEPKAVLDRVPLGTEFLGDHCGRSIARGCWLLSTSGLVPRGTDKRQTLSRRPWQSTTASAPPRVSRTLTATGAPGSIPTLASCYSGLSRAYSRSQC